MNDVDPLDLVETIREAILVLEPDLTIRFANRSVYNTFAVAPEQTVGRKLHETFPNSAPRSRPSFQAEMAETPSRRFKSIIFSHQSASAQ
jgi:PAS domain-containing protein